MDLELLQTATLYSVNTRIEYHGEDREIAVDLDLVINGIEAGELDQLSIDGEHYSRAFWDKDGSPRFGLLKTQSIDLKVEDHSAIISIESAQEFPEKDRGEIHFKPVVIKKIKFSPKHHGVADMTLQVQGSLYGKDLAKLVDKYLGERLTFTCGPMNASLLDESGDSQADPKSAPLASVATS